MERPKTSIGKVCLKHPELKGARSYYACPACRKEAEQRQYKTPRYRERKRIAMARLYQTNAAFRDRARKRAISYEAARYARDPEFRLLYIARRRIKNALRGRTKSQGTLGLLGVPSIMFYKSYLETQFQPGMTWDNYGAVWHVDHRIPLSLLSMTTPEDQRFGFHYKNTRPMFAKDNISRGNKLVFEDLL